MSEPTTAYLPDPANDETLTMSGYEWWRYFEVIADTALAAYRADLAAKVGSGDESTGLPHWHYARGGRDRADEVAGVFVERAAVLALIEGEPR